jgi:hypothetical protein|tara:strand:+ start:1730 stop:2128 length:399 start_codon:yes stop_codon:yes gene_type:complete
MTRAPMRSTRRPRARIARRSVDSRGGRQHRSRAFSIDHDRLADVVASTRDDEDGWMDWIKPDVIHTRGMMTVASSSTARLAPTTKSARRVRARVRARGAVVVRAGRFETERTYIMIKCVVIRLSSGRMNEVT